MSASSNRVLPVPPVFKGPDPLSFMVEFEIEHKKIVDRIQSVLFLLKKYQQELEQAKNNLLTDLASLIANIKKLNEEIAEIQRSNIANGRTYGKAFRAYSTKKNYLIQYDVAEATRYKAEQTPRIQKLAKDQDEINSTLVSLTNQCALLKNETSELEQDRKAALLQNRPLKKITESDPAESHALELPSSPSISFKLGHTSQASSFLKPSPLQNLESVIGQELELAQTMVKDFSERIVCLKSQNGAMDTGTYTAHDLLDQKDILITQKQALKDLKLRDQDQINKDKAQALEKRIDSQIKEINTELKKATEIGNFEDKCLLSEHNYALVCGNKLTEIKTAILTSENFKKLEENTAFTQKIRLFDRYRKNIEAAKNLLELKMAVMADPGTLKEGKEIGKIENDVTEEGDNVSFSLRSNAGLGFYSRLFHNKGKNGSPLRSTSEKYMLRLENELVRITHQYNEKTVKKGAEMMKAHPLLSSRIREGSRRYLNPR